MFPFQSCYFVIKSNLTSTFISSYIQRLHTITSSACPNLLSFFYRCRVIQKCCMPTNIHDCIKVKKNLIICHFHLVNERYRSCPVGSCRTVARLLETGELVCAFNSAGSWAMLVLLTIPRHPFQIVSSCIDSYSCQMWFVLPDGMLTLPQILWLSIHH